MCPYRPAPSGQWDALCRTNFVDRIDGCNCNCLRLAPAHRLAAFACACASDLDASQPQTQPDARAVHACWLACGTIPAPYRTAH